MQSEQIGELAAALAKAQAVMQGASKDATNPHFKSKYADLASIWDACRKPLSDNGLAVVQLPVESEVGSVGLTTTLLHSSGQWIQSTVSAPLQQNTAQAVGSAITYLRRYSLAAVAGVAPDDDDGSAASQPAQRSQAQPQRKADYVPAPTPQPTETTAERTGYIAELRGLANEARSLDLDPGFAGRKPADMSIKEMADHIDRLTIEIGTARDKKSAQESLYDEVDSELLRGSSIGINRIAGVAR